MAASGKTRRGPEPPRRPPPPPTITFPDIPSLPAEPMPVPTPRLRPAVNPPPRELPTSPQTEAQLLSIIDELRGELRRSQESREAFEVAVAERAELGEREHERERRKKTSVFDSLRPRTKGGWAIGISAIVATIGTAVAAIVTAVGGGEGLANVFHAPKLRENIEALHKKDKELEEKLKLLQEGRIEDQARARERAKFISAALCKGANVTARGLDCDAVEWEPPRVVVKRGEPPPPWRARNYTWPSDPPPKP